MDSDNGFAPVDSSWDQIQQKDGNHGEGSHIQEIVEGLLPVIIN